MAPIAETNDHKAILGERGFSVQLQTEKLNDHEAFILEALFMAMNGEGNKPLRYHDLTEARKNLEVLRQGIRQMTGRPVRITIEPL